MIDTALLPGVIIIWAVGIFLAALIQYFVIRLAITHALRARDPRPAPAVQTERSSHLDEDGL